MIYLASPYSHWQYDVRKERYKAVRDLTVKAMPHIIYISPIVHMHHVAVELNLDFGWEIYETMNKMLLRKSDAIHVMCLEGWQESKGVTVELKWAKQMGLPIHYIDEFGRPVLTLE